MDIAIIGLPQSGKTTIFNALTRGKADTTGAGGPGAEMHVGVIKVPDSRLDVLAQMYQRGKIVHAEIKYWDLPALEMVTKSQGIGGKYRNILQAADAFLLVVRAFTNPSVPHPLGQVDLARDLETMLSELTFADLEVLDRAIQRLDGNIKKARPTERPAQLRHLEAAQKAKAGIEAGIPLRRQQLTESEASFLVSYQLLTGKPIIVAFNTDESSPELSLGELNLPLWQRGARGDAPLSIASEDGDTRSEALGEVSLCGKLEAELASMSPEEEVEFREALGLGESATTQVIRASYETLGLVSFLTIGADEVRAWSVPAGLPAQEAAGAIHTDFYRGFIRAEVISYDDLVRCGSIAQGRKEGLLRSEGKTYRVKDGDVINFLINT
jgi:GTP-binding protein YchF